MGHQTARRMLPGQQGDEVEAEQLARYVMDERIHTGPSDGQHPVLYVDGGAQRPADGTAESEAEWRTVQRLLPRLAQTFYHHMDVVVADAEYCTQVFLQAVRGYG